MHFLLVLAAMGTVSVAAYFRDLFNSVSELDDPRGASAMEAMLDAYAIAELVAIAVMTDGQLTEQELSALRELTEARLGDPSEAERCLESMRFRDRLAGDWEGVVGLVRETAMRLSLEQRQEAFALIAQLAASGSGLSGEAGYRTYAPTDPEGLLDAIAAGLGLDEAQQREAGRTT